LENLSAGVWNQIVLTFSGTLVAADILNESIVYVNAVNNCTVPSATPLSDFAPSNVMLGSGDSSYDNHSTQSLTRFFTKELNQDEVTYLHNNGNGRRSIGHFNGNTNLVDGLLAYYKCNDNLATTNVIDATGVYDGTMSVNTSVLHTASGKHEGGFDYGLGTNDYFYTPLESSPGDVFDYDKSFCISIWFEKSAEVPTDIMGNSQTSIIGNYWLHNAAGLTWYMRDGSANHWTANIPAASQATGWNHLLLGLTGTGLQASIYTFLNGVDVSSRGGTNPTLVGSMASTQQWWFGRTPHYGGGTTRKMDEIAVYNKAPTQAMATDLYNLGDGLYY